MFLNGTATPRDAPVFGKDWYATYLWTEFGLKFIDEARQASKPFFLYLPFNAPHFPLMAPAELIAKYRGKYKAGWDRMRQERYQRQVRMGLIDAKWPLSPREPDTPPWDSLSDQQKERFDHQMAVYAAMIEAIDTAVGTLVKGLEARKVLDNTLIFFMSDNGGNAESGPDGRFNGDPPGGPNSDLYLGMNWAAVGNTPFRRFKHFTHEGGISSPLIVHWPRGIAANRRGAIERQPAHLIDIMATVTAATGAKYPTEYKGRAIHPMEGVVCGRRSTAVPSTGPRPLFWEHEGNRAVRSGNWKIVSVSRAVGAVRHRRRSRRAQQRRGTARGHRDEALRRMGRVGQTDERGSVAGSGATPLGRQCAGARPRRTAPVARRSGPRALDNISGRCGSSDGIRCARSGSSSAAHRQSRPWSGAEVTARAPRPRHSIRPATSVPGTRGSAARCNPGYARRLRLRQRSPVRRRRRSARAGAARRHLPEPPGQRRVARVVCYSPRHDVTLAELDGRRRRRAARRRGSSRCASWRRARGDATS